MKKMQWAVPVGIVLSWDYNNGRVSTLYIIYFVSLGIEHWIYGKAGQGLCDWATSSACRSTYNNPFNLVSSILIQSFRNTPVLPASKILHEITRHWDQQLTSLKKWILVYLLYLCNYSLSCKVQRMHFCKNYILKPNQGGKWNFKIILGSISRHTKRFQFPIAACLGYTNWLNPEG